MGVPELECNRLALVWRPIIDLSGGEFAPMRLRFVAPVADWIADPRPERRLWFSRIGVPGLRSQVVRHAGLRDWDCRTPEQLSRQLWTPRWERLVESVQRFGELDDTLRALVVFQLGQLSFAQHAADLAAGAMPDGNPNHDWYVLTAARVAARLPGRVGSSISVLEQIALGASDPVLSLTACFQALGYLRRAGAEPDERTKRLERRARDVTIHDDDIRSLLWSRLHRAFALQHLADGDVRAGRAELAAAWACHEQLGVRTDGDIDRCVVAENESFLLECQLTGELADSDSRDERAVRAVCARLLAADPHNVDVHLAVGDAYVCVGALDDAVSRYLAAGQFATAGGALG